MTCFSSQHFCVESAADVDIKVRRITGYMGRPAESVTIAFGYADLVISGAPGIADELLQVLRSAIAQWEDKRDADHVERAMQKDAEVSA